MGLYEQHIHCSKQIPCFVAHDQAIRNMACYQCLAKFIRLVYHQNLVWHIHCFRLSVSNSVSFSHIPLCRTSSLATTWINESTRALFSSTTQGSLCGPQKKMGALITGRLRSAEWRIVMEQLDSVNVFIFPMLKFKNWKPFLAPGCTLSCLKRSYYLLRMRHRGLGGFAHQLITKHQKGTIHQK